MAHQRGLTRLAQKSESYEICFVPDNDYRQFLKTRVPNLSKKVGLGDFVLTDGTKVGQHKGYPFYTIGQRKGLDLALGYPAYVIDIDAKHNRIVLGQKKDLKKTCMQVKDPNWIKYEHIPEKGLSTVTKIRHHHEGAPAWIRPHQNDRAALNVHFDRAVSAVAPGQAAVFYENDDVIGGGWIEKETFLPPWTA